MSLHKDPRPGKSKYWYCAFTLADGRRALRSTGKTNKKEAEIICRHFEDTEGMVRRGDATADTLMKAVNDTLKRLGQEQVKHPSASEYFQNWKTQTTLEISEPAMKRYAHVIEKFLDSLGPKADKRLSSVTTDDISKFRDSLAASGRTASTINLMVKGLLNRPFKAAVANRVIDRNPIDGLGKMKGTRTEKKGLFTSAHIVRLLQAAEGDWKGLILAAYYTGQRQMDLATLRWDAVDLDAEHEGEHAAITFTQRKTGTFVEIPIHPELREYLTNVASSDDPKAYVFPELAEKRGAGMDGLSETFKAIMAKAGIDGGMIRERSGTAGRNLAVLSFHSLRYSCNSALASKGVSQEHRRLMTGHASDKMNAHYTLNQFESLRTAVNKLPRLPKE